VRASALALPTMGGDGGPAHVCGGLLLEPPWATLVRISPRCGAVQPHLSSRSEMRQCRTVGLVPGVAVALGGGDLLVSRGDAGGVASVAYMVGGA
jgi:hypothetical protein